jgi:PTS system mannose-specific IIA component
MIGIVLVTHGRLGAEFMAAVEHVVGKQTQLAAVAIGPDDNMEAKRAEILAAVKQVEKNAGVIVMTDMFGGTPSNLAISIMPHAEVEVISGLNLPMLIKLASIRATEPIKAAATQAQEAGRKYINIA